MDSMFRCAPRAGLYGVVAPCQRPGRAGLVTALAVVLMSVALAGPVMARPDAGSSRPASADVRLVSGGRDYPGVLILTVASPAFPCFGLGDTVDVTLSMCCLQQLITGYQAFVEFDPTVLTFVQGSYILPDPFGLPLAPIIANGNLISLAAGINVFNGQPPTQADADLATFVFVAAAPGGVELVLPDHLPPTSFVYDSTRYIPDRQGTGPFQVSVQCPVALGDLNCDGVVDFDDINAFVLALSDMQTYQAAFPDCNAYNGDGNCDGTVDFDDINPFVGCLTGDCHCP